MAKAKKFIEGDRVKISPVGRQKWSLSRMNPDCAGTVGQVGNWVSVQWDNGIYNAYPMHIHLTPAE